MTAASARLLALQRAWKAAEVEALEATYQAETAFFAARLAGEDTSEMPAYPGDLVDDFRSRFLDEPAANLCDVLLKLQIVERDVEELSGDEEAVRAVRRDLMRLGGRRQVERA